MTAPPRSIDQLAEGFAHIITLTPAGNEEPDHVYRSFRDVFGTEAGQRVLGWLCMEGFLFPHGEDQANAETLERLAGRRHMVQWILRNYSIPPPKPKAEEKPVSPLDRK